ncbi:MAG: Unknown protein [uncultured Thiotrichaceae bacterium]|uniref:Uncharacterized protein n=1 Tax=uncultured Thiotrichaceae bacterium TaxID=298394 RepID=A0A6S6SZV4_9GAMM|nr:MAG: Unknown protein [uncultured Thiotrichaceae bacterium]
MPGGVKILGTALTEQFQKIQLEMNLLPPAPNHKKGRKIVYTMFGFSVLAGIAAAGGTYFYQQSELINKAVIKKSAIHPEPTLTTPANNPVPTIPVAGATEPEQEKPLLLSQQDKPSPVPENMAISSPIISTQTKEAEKPLTPARELESAKAPEPEKPQIQSASPVTIETEEAQEPELIIQSPEILTQTTAIVSMEDIADSFPVTEFPVKKPDNGNKDHIITAPAEKQSDTPLTSTDTSSDQDETAEKKMDQQATSVSKDVKIDEEKLTANGLNRKQLIERAYNAIEKGNLSEQADSGSIYYIRLLKRISPTHPQVRRLAREVVSAYHIKARASIKLKQTRNASQHLWIAGRIIEEFSLSEINKAQLVLKQRLAE